MTVEALIAMLESEAAVRLLSERVRQLLRHAIEELAAEPSGLPDAELFRRLRQWFGAEFLEETFPAPLERHGFFTRLPSGNWGLADRDRMERRFAEMPVCILDFEATGGRPPLHRIIEMGLIRIEPDGTETRFESLVNPGRPLPPYITFMTGLKQATLDQAPPMEALQETLDRFLDGALVVAHDVSGDLELLNYEIFRRHGRLVEQPIACTVAMTRALRPAIEKSGLEMVARELGIPFEQKHRALADAEATAGIWNVLREDLVRAGVSTLADLAFYQGQIGTPLFLTNRLSVERLAQLPVGPGLFLLRDAAGRKLHAEAVADLRKGLHDCFYPRHRLPPFLKRIVRESADFELTPFPSLGEAREALRAEGSGERRRQHSRGGRGRRRRKPGPPLPKASQVPGP